MSDPIFEKALEHMQKVEEQEEIPIESKVNEALTSDEYMITGQSFSRETGDPTGSVRDEVIDIKTNEIFKDVTSILDIKKAYEAFWNELNPNSKDIVFVSSIKPKIGEEPEEDEERVPAEEPPIESKEEVVEGVEEDSLERAAKDLAQRLFKSEGLSPQETVDRVVDIVKSAMSELRTKGESKEEVEEGKIPDDKDSEETKIKKLTEDEGEPAPEPEKVEEPVVEPEKVEEPVEEEPEAKPAEDEKDKD